MAMISRGTRLHVARDPWARDGVRFALVDEAGGKVYVGAPPVMAETDSAVLLEPTFSLSSEAAQALIDSLWDCGLRPTAGHGSAGQLAATERHLDDMRKLVFKENK